MTIKETVYTFKRYEKKYLLSPGRYEAFMKIAGEHLVPDAYHKSTVRSVYYDTDDFSLIRHSIEGPVYKEKLRVRSYGPADPAGTVFVELKKKYKGVVYKRRVEMPAQTAEDWLAGRSGAPVKTQITREIDWFLKMNPVVPKAYIACDRVSWAGKENPELRFTFDSNIRWRDNDVTLLREAPCADLLENGQRLLEIKIPSAAPLWLARLLSDEAIFPTGYSKYGTCYKKEILGRLEFAAAEDTEY